MGSGGNPHRACVTRGAEQDPDKEMIAVSGHMWSRVTLMRAVSGKRWLYKPLLGGERGGMRLGGRGSECGQLILLWSRDLVIAGLGWAGLG